MTFSAQLRSSVRAARDVLTSPFGSVLGVLTSAPVFALTFDDGPDPHQTPAVLDQLATHQARATFFMLVNRAREHPELVEAVVAAGHEVALHGLTHRRLTQGSTAQALAEIAQGHRELSALSGQQIRFFRPPYGAQTLSIWRGVRRAGLQVVLWGPSLWDWKQASPEDRSRKALQGFGAGAIVLAHDGLAGPADGASATPTPDLDRAAWAGQWLGRYRSEFGLRSVPVSALLAAGPAIRAARFGR